MNLTLSSAIRSKQKQGGLSVSALAKAIGVSQVSVAAVLKGTSFPNKTTAAKYAKFLGLTAKAFSALHRNLPVVLRSTKSSAKVAAKAPVKTPAKSSAKSKTSAKTAIKTATKTKAKVKPDLTKRLAKAGRRPTAKATKVSTLKDAGAVVAKVNAKATTVRTSKELSLTELVALAGDTMALAVHQAPSPTRKVIEALLRT